VFSSFFSPDVFRSSSQKKEVLKEVVVFLNTNHTELVSIIEGITGKFKTEVDISEDAVNQYFLAQSAYRDVCKNEAIKKQFLDRDSTIKEMENDSKKIYKCINILDSKEFIKKRVAVLNNSSFKIDRAEREILFNQAVGRLKEMMHEMFMSMTKEAVSILTRETEERGLRDFFSVKKILTEVYRDGI